MIYDILPGVGAGDLRFGMARDEVRNRVPGRCLAAARSADEDYFSDAGVHVDFDDQNRLISVTFSRPSGAALLGQNLVDVPYAIARSTILKAGGALVDTVVGATSFDLGVGLDGADEPDELVESVIVFIDGYYDGVL